MKSDIVVDFLPISWAIFAVEFNHFRFLLSKPAATPQYHSTISPSEAPRSP